MPSTIISIQQGVNSVTELSLPIGSIIDLVSASATMNFSRSKSYPILLTINSASATLNGSIITFTSTTVIINLVAADTYLLQNCVADLIINLNNSIPTNPVIIPDIYCIIGESVT